ncbi:hypothetical protein D9613_012226 [Agrocybe pediades]|uniref:Fungal-type protein kinase domain-containing protein n=1 Tax=Agrocybe pediades TaxID=84607 RepID=A0A8H4QF26_9AGAR|nr:hypothetical protein D9613_012226 [Agrocybe pediades]
MFKTVKEIVDWTDKQYPTDEQELDQVSSGLNYCEDEDRAESEKTLAAEGVFNYIAKFESEGGKFPVRLFTCPSRKSFDTDELPAYGPKWCTMGPPLWPSPELIGDDSYIFRVREFMESDGHEAYLDTNPVLLKTYWREGAAAAQEASIYTRLQNAYPEGLARVLYGGDVVVPGTKTAITAGTSSTNSSLVLGRMIFQNAGSPLWEYSDEGEFFHGLKSAVIAHQDLCKRGILHRGINPASIYLVENDNLPPHVYGFLLDLQYACIIASSESAKTENAQFSALEILQRLCISPSAAGITHTATHDVQSFVWATSYTLLRRAQTKLLRLLTRTTDEIAKNDIETDYTCIHSRLRQRFLPDKL